MFTLLSGESWDEQFLATAAKACDSAQNNDGKFDWDWVEKSVAASEPPRLMDIADHISFLKKWGGGVKQHLAIDMMDFIEAQLPSGRIVSGNFFRSLSYLKFPPAEMMPHTVYACLFAQAVLPYKIKENVGLSIETNHVKSLTTTKKTDGMIIEDMITKARTVMLDRGVSRREVNIECGLFSVALIKCMFELDKDDPNRPKTFNEVAARHVHAFAGVQQGTLEAQPTKPNAKNPEGPNLTFGGSSGGQNNAGQITLKMHGFEINSTIEFKTAKIGTDNSKQYAIKYINEDGSAGVHAVNVDGTIDESSIEAFTLDDIIQKMKPAKARIELFKDYTNVSISESKPWAELPIHSCVAKALHEINEDPSFEDVVLRPRKTKQ